MQSSKTVAIVDPVSTGAHLAPEFARRGWRTVAVLSSGKIPDAYIKGFRPGDFTDVITHTGDTEQTLTRLAALQPQFVLAGAEHGVELADLLAESLALPGNGTALSACRRDKFAMVERIRAAGLPAAASLITQDAAAIADWAEQGGHWPIVVKPVASAGSDGVAFCSTPAEAEQAFTAILGTTNQLGGFNDQVMAQERLIGDQYFVNTVSRAGRHYVAEIWKDVRVPVGDNQVYDREELQPGQGEIQAAIVAYVERVLDALGIAYGPAHTEIMLTARGPVLIESGARLQGAVTPAPHAAATGTSQVALTVDACTDPDTFDQLPGTTYQLERQLRVVSLISPHEGALADGPALAELNTLPTLSATVRSLAPGTPVRRTVDLFSSPDHLYLLDADLAAVERDYARIRELEHGGLYTAAATATAAGA
ncbi:ATP-grasp domain-containing protein [Streptomyces sp. NPDC058268]|uniref:ATP-grasp domain-containing protein n=1 Tax=Streptomyces sp. NPDC058268 TaxID=3346413 RepID=UPI0036E1E793